MERHEGEHAFDAVHVGDADVIKKIQHLTVAIDPGSIATVTRGAITFTVTGAAAGDMLVASPPAALNDDLIFCGVRVTGANEGTVYLYNPTAGAIDDAEQTWDFLWFDLT